MLKLVPFYFCCTGFQPLKLGSFFLFFYCKPVWISRASFSSSLRYLLPHGSCWPSCITAWLLYQIVCQCQCFLSACAASTIASNAEDVIPVQELKGTSLPSLIVESWDWVDNSEMLNWSWKCKVSTLEDCAPQNVKDPCFFFFVPHEMFQSCQRNANMFHKLFSYFCLFVCFFYIINII